MNVYRIKENLYDIRLDFKQTNTRNFLSTWVYKNTDLCFLVDCGPTSTIQSVKKCLNEIGIHDQDLDFILLTHVHIDHAGGVGNLISYFPRAKVICHPKGIEHLINPKRLWQGSKKTLGILAKWYGKIKPVPQNRIFFQETIANGKIRVIETLGHAPHHQSYLFDQILFIGEAAGTHQLLINDFYLRPATPPVFDYDTWKLSVQKLLAEDLVNCRICYPHYGMREDASLMIKNAQHQLSIWFEVIDSFFNIRNQPDFYEQVILELIKRDEFFAKNKMMDEETRKREMIFIRNSIDGIVGYIKKKKQNNL
ncbi:MAG: MBL fold metallo-hydrolase [Promethearchaeota archaeon]